eukprot:CAMPEP_0196588070 /NCGR_PEP_ID=MMETSP1081-20130531/59497_1 /TAXON_ID=36882 /ORGANISM="Pyramimonas amylifera, Strain CCMP720" /LENGTH=319 /DNA_ID=CAMNT_0041910459 /DNA_START=274 /DNA_END=1233 /DNA_ORIENTATION=+
MKNRPSRCEASRIDVVNAFSGLKKPPPYHPTQDIKEIIRLSLAEDAGDLGDITSLATIPADTQTTATFLAKADGILAGVIVADMVFEALDPNIKTEWTSRDGDRITKGMKFGTATGSAISLLTAERVALNLMQRMSGIATATHLMAEAAKPAIILDTRKTAPGLRVLDKWAVTIGGGENHRMGLYDMLMIKDNHVESAGGITAAVTRARDYLSRHNLQLTIELETRTLDEVKEAMEVVKGAKPRTGEICRIMLDNMDVSTMKEAVQIIGGAVATEASGNVTIDSVEAIGKSGVTYISSGALTHSVAALDISFNVESVLS